MTATLSLPGEGTSVAFAARWALAATAVVAIHAAGGWVLLHQRSADPIASVSDAAVLVDLAPLPAAPPVAPTPTAPNPSSAQDAQADAPPPAAPPAPPIDEPAPSQPAPPPAAATEQIDATPPAVPAQRPTFTPPLPRPRPAELPSRPAAKPAPKPEASPPRAIRPATPVARARPAEPPGPRSAAPRAAAASATASIGSPAAAAAWKGSVMAHLARFTRSAPAGLSGTVTVAFTIDRGGRVLAARLVGSSGNATLDGDATSLLRRASPVPAPPDGFGAATIPLVVPVRYSER